MVNPDYYIDILKDISSIIKMIEMFFVIIMTYYAYIKITDIKRIKIKDYVVIIITTIPLSIIANIIKLEILSYLRWTIIILVISIINYSISKKDLINTIISSVISLSISYGLYVLAVMISFFPIVLINIKNELVALGIIISIFIVFNIITFKIKKLKHGISFLQRKLENQNFSILILNIGIMILLSITILHNYSVLNVANIGMTFAIILFVMVITIKQSFNLYYKQKLLTKDLEETKRELETKKNEIEKLEKENLEFSKTSHSLAHKQKAIEFKLEQLMNGSIDKDSKEKMKEEIEKIHKEVYREPDKVELDKTGIESIDNMLSYMQSECIRDNIQFDLQVVGNIYYMINNLITENDLEILIADHIKDAIFAINFSDNSNRSILVRIGKIDNTYSLYIYDSGLEFEKEVLDNLGKKPITTYSDSGGTGMGFMNTFDTLNKTKASLIINEIGKPCVDNYTKVLIFKFDNKKEFRVDSYKNEIIV